MNKTILKSKNIKSEAFRENSHLQDYVTSGWLHSREDVNAHEKLRS